MSKWLLIIIAILIGYTVLKDKLSLPNIFGGNSGLGTNPAIPFGGFSPPMTSPG